MAERATVETEAVVIAKGAMGAEPRPAGRGLASGSARSSRSVTALHAAAAFSLLAALIHLWVMPEHFEVWWGYGAFFLASFAAQGFYAAALLRWPHRPLLLVGVGGNLAIVVLYLLTRTVGIPFFGPHAGEREGFGTADLAATAAELALLGALGVMLLRGLPRERVVVLLFVLALVGLFVGHMLHLMLSLTPAHQP